MRSTQDAFHLAIPSHDLDAAAGFYVEGLGCKLARRYADRITLDFFDDLVERHRTVVLRDPSNNLLEFKHYDDPRMMF